MGEQQLQQLNSTYTSKRKILLSHCNFRIFQNCDDLPTKVKIFVVAIKQYVRLKISVKKLKRTICQRMSIYLNFQTNAQSVQKKEQTRLEGTNGQEWQISRRTKYLICKDTYKIGNCEIFQSQPIHEPAKIIKKTLLCTNCLRARHTS